MRKRILLTTLFLVALAPLVAAKTWVVDASGVDPGDRTLDAAE